METAFRMTMYFAIYELFYFLHAFYFFFLPFFSGVIFLWAMRLNDLIIGVEIVLFLVEMERRGVDGQIYLMHL
jgi:hypothetical protein